MVTPTTDKSIKRFHSRPRARVRLFCFPWAGVGASAFFRWSRDLPHEIEVNAVQYPGREDRYRETPIRRVSPLVELLLRDLHSYRDRPFAFWGHSMGALVAYELTRQLTGAGGPSPGHLFVSGRQPPQLPERFGPIHDLPDAEFFRELQRRYRGVPDAIARDPELRDFPAHDPRRPRVGPRVRPRPRPAARLRHLGHWRYRRLGEPRATARLGSPHQRDVPDALRSRRPLFPQHPKRSRAPPRHRRPAGRLSIGVGRGTVAQGLSIARSASTFFQIGLCHISARHSLAGRCAIRRNERETSLGCGICLQSMPVAFFGTQEEPVRGNLVSSMALGSSTANPLLQTIEVRDEPAEVGRVSRDVHAEEPDAAPITPSLRTLEQ